MQSINTLDNNIKILLSIWFDLFAGKIKAINQLWLIGDEFADRSYLENFKHAKAAEDTNQLYCVENFDILTYTTTQYSSSVRNVLARFRLLIAKAISDNTLLPKLILIVPDDDIICQSKVSSEGVEGFKYIMSSLIEKIHRLITGYKTKLPKSQFKTGSHTSCGFCHQRTGISTTIQTGRDLQWPWNKYLQITITAIVPSNCALRLKNVWDEHDTDLYYQDQGRFTQKGLHTYWEAIDAAVKFWGRTFSDIMLKKQKKNAFKSNVAHKQGILENQSKHTSNPGKPNQLPSKHKDSRTHQHNFTWSSRIRPEIGFNRKDHGFHKRDKHDKLHGRKLPTPPPARGRRN